MNARTPRPDRAERRTIDRSIAALAVPALGALLAEPLFLVVDTALIGHLGGSSLAGLAIAAAVLHTVVGLMIFLAYSTTPAVARLRGGGRLREAAQAGVDGLWLALTLGTVVGVGLWAATPTLVSFFTSDSAAAAEAVSYLAVSCVGLPAMLVVFAATGLLRGFQDTRTPLYVAGIGFTVNALLNWLFIYGFGWGIAGSAWGTVVAQWGMVAAYLLVIARILRRYEADWRPRSRGFAAAGRTGGWVFVRTLGLRLSLLLTVAAATSDGNITAAGYQVVFTVFSTASFALDALAIASQALIGDALGARNADRARQVMGRAMRWGVLGGAGVGLMLAAVSPVLGHVFTNDPEVLAVLPFALLVLGISLPLGGYVFVADGVLLGAGDMRYLAGSSLVNAVLYLPVLWLLTRSLPTGAAGLALLTAAFTIVFMAARALTLWWRIRSARWLVLGDGVSKD